MKKYFMKKINLLQILIHLIATLFFIFSSRTLSGLYNIKILKIISENGVENTMRNMDKYGLTTQDISNFSFVTNISGFIGITLAFTISVIISLRNKWSIINSFIVYMSSFLLHRFGVLNSKLLKYGTENFISDLFFRLLLVGIIFLIIGFLIFFSKKTNGIIEKYQGNNKLYC
jgi:hypothetical protein